jgi:type II secretory pathway pseudopilin PulG
MKNPYGFTLIELVILIVTLGIIAAVAIPQFADVAGGAKVTATRDEMMRLRQAIVGDPSVVAGGQYVDRGFAGDVGFAPSNLVDLVVKPDSISAYDKLTRLGWNGPYIDGSDNSYLVDAWGTLYSFDPGGRRIVSPGAGEPGDSIIVTF